MKYAALIRATLKALALIAIVAGLVLLVRDRLPDTGDSMVWSIFIPLAAAALGVAFAFGAKGCLREIERLKGQREEPDNQA